MTDLNMLLSCYREKMSACKPVAFYPSAEIPAAGDADRVRVELLGTGGSRVVLHDQFEGLKCNTYVICDFILQ